MKLIVAGGRDFNDYELLKEKLDYFLCVSKEIEIVSGGQKTINPDGPHYGADYLGECYAKEKGFYLTVFPADWKTHGKAAGMIRNKQMAEYATHLVAFWDGESKGTKNMIDTATKMGLGVRVVRYD